eukprot:m.83797 g.83797  ORF g.83797 m.83797 type:complete len:760 (+) comp14362_c0_seq1:174-2453(+)
MFELTVVKSTSTDEAVRNRLVISANSEVPPSVRHVYVNPRDGGRFALTLERSEKLKPADVAANVAQRTWAKLSLGERLRIEPIAGPFDGAGLVVAELDFWKKGTSQSTRYKIEELQTQFRETFSNMILTPNQLILFQFKPSNAREVLLSVTIREIRKFDERSLTGGGLHASEQPVINMGISGPHTQYTFGLADGCMMSLSGGTSATMAKKSIISPNWKFEDMGIGGLDEQFSVMFRRAFASRVLPLEIVEKLGIQHCKGILLYGPPGTGKTLMARKIAMMLEGREPKIVNGPEILSKYVGEAEKNIRELFADAETEYKAKGEMSSLHVIIMDELDAICRQRGSVQSGTGVHDSIVNQLLSKIDGVESLNNILLIGMTNRLDMIDEALLRPGRLELKMQIGLPDEAGREQIFVIHTKKMNESNMLAHDVDLKELASVTKNFSGAEIAGVCRSAASFASNRCIKFEGNVEVKAEELANIKVTREDFLNAVQEVTPAFGAATEELDDCARNGIVHWGPPVDHVLGDGQLLIQQAENSTRTPLVSLLLAGGPGTGKTALAATLALRSTFPLVKLISPEHMVGYSEFAKVNRINKVFEDAYKSRLSVIVIDDIERLLDYSAMGNRFSNVILQALLVLLKKSPPKGHKLFIIGTTSKPSILDLMGITETFSKVIHAEHLTAGHQVMKVIDDLQPFAEHDIELIRQALSQGRKLTHGVLQESVEISLGIKKLYMLLEMARQAEENSSEKFLESLFDECRYNTISRD